MEYIKSAMNIAGFPDEARRPILEAAKLVLADSRCAVLTKKLLNREFNDTQTEIVDPLKAAAAEYGVHEYTMVMAFYLLATELLLEKYRDAGIDEQNFREMLTDYRCKLMECHDNYGIWGTASMAWHAPFFTLARIQLGRFQYDNAVFPYEIYTKRGYTIKKNDPCVRFHIRHPVRLLPPIAMIHTAAHTDFSANDLTVLFRLPAFRGCYIRVMRNSSRLTPI